MRGKPWILAMVIGPVVVLDQLTKVIVERQFHLHESVVVIRGFFSLTYIRNPGAAFGIFADQTGVFRTFFFLSVSFAAIVLLLYFVKKTPETDRFSLSALSLLMGGAVGNLIDRIRLGEVIDFLDFYIGRYHWPAFNVADSAITVGISLLILESFVRRPAHQDSKPFPMP